MTMSPPLDQVDEIAICLRGLPRRLKIGAYDWKVIFEEKDDSPEEELCGQAVFATDTIRLWPKNFTSASHVVGIVIHECLHVIFDHHGLEKLKRGRDEREEQIVLGFEAGLISLFRDNPRLLLWMRKWLKPQP